MASRGLSEDDDTYWTASKASKIKKFGINQFDDDNVGFKDIFKQIDKYKDDDDDIVNWDGTTPNKTPASSTSNISGRTSLSTEGLSARYRPPSSTPSVSASTSSGSISSGQRAARTTPDSRGVPTSLSIKDVVGSVNVPNKTDVAKLEAEVNYLRRTVNNEKRSRFVPLAPKDTVKNIIFGKEFILEGYKSKESKLELLDEAIKTQDGNAIITAVLFLRDTVKSAIFNLELMQRPVAVDQYVSYLKQIADTNTLMDVLGFLGRNEEAAMIKLKQAVSIMDPEKKVKTLETCKRAHFDSEPHLSLEASLIEEQIIAIGHQMPVEKADQALETQGDPKFKAIPRVATVVDQPIITWLFYCCLYHYNVGENNFASPLAIKKSHRLTEKEYMWNVLIARAKVKVWKDINTLFTTKGWLGSTKIKCPLGFHRIIPVLHSYNAPLDVLNTYCKLIDDPEKRLEIGQKYGCYVTVIETFRQMRDRQQLQKYCSSLKPHSPEWFFSNDVLRDQTVKWKN